MTDQDRFWITFGKTVTVFSFVWLWACAVLFLILMLQGYAEQEKRPYAIYAPDSTHKPARDK